MGQRHQIYVFYHNSKYVQDAPGALKCIAFHNQWCYGTLPLQNVKRFIKFQSKANEYTQISLSEGMDGNDPEKIRMILSLDVANGNFSCIHDVTQEVTTEEGWINPDFGDIQECHLRKGNVVMSNVACHLRFFEEGAEYVIDVQYGGIQRVELFRATNREKAFQVFNGFMIGRWRRVS